MIMSRKAVLALGFGLLAAGSPAVAPAQPVAERGPATLRAEGEDEPLQWAASVSVVNDLAQEPETAKLFGVTGGDPAMNGLYTYLAFYISPGDGWRVFKIGDFLEYRIVSQGPGRVVLAINESVMDAQSNISSRRRRLAVTWRRAPDGAPPATVRVATAR